MEFSDAGERELQSVYNKYDHVSRLHIEVPKNLCDLYDFHKTKILRDYKGYYANKEGNNQKIFDFCYGDFVYGDFWLFPDEDLEKSDEDILLTIQHATISPGPLQPGKDFKITKHPHPGHSGAEIYVLHGNSRRNARIAKVLKCPSLEELKQGFLELSKSLIVLSLNPDPTNLKMPRILSAGFSHFSKSKEPYVFCMIIEKARGKSIKELLHSKYIDQPDSFEEVLKDSAQFMANFHVKFSQEFIRNNKIDNDVKNVEIKDREKFCRRRISVLLQDLGFNLRGDSFFNFKEALKNIEGIVGQGIQAPPMRGKNPESTGEHISFGQHLRDTLSKFEKWHLALEDRVMNHGDMHIGNLCYEAESENPLGNLCYEAESEIQALLRLWMIDFSSTIRTYGAIGDPAQDVGKFIGSIWKEIALCAADAYGDKDRMEFWYNTLCKWQEVFIETYTPAYTHTEAEFQARSPNHVTSSAINQESPEPFNRNKMATFRERVYFYKLCLYAQFFDDTQIGVEAKDLLKAKQLLLYFLLHESDLLGASNLEHTRQDPHRSWVEVPVEFSLARTGPTGSKIIAEGECYVFSHT